MRRLIWLLCVVLWPMSNASHASAGTDAPAGQLTFSQALKRICDSHLKVQLSQTQLNIASDQVMAARAAFSPELDLRASFQAADSKTAGTNPADSPVSTHEQVYSANASWNVFRFGADVATLNWAQGQRQAEIASHEQSYLSAEEEGTAALLNLIEKQQVLEAYTHSELSVAHFLEIARARFAKSLLSKEEADKVAVDASNAEARRADAELKFHTSQAQVRALLGEGQVQLAWPWQAKFKLENLKTYLSLEAFELAVKSRPDIQAAQYSLESEEDLGHSKFRTLLPSIDLTYSLAQTHLGAKTLNGWTSMATLTIPLWSGLKDYAAYRIQVENKYAAKARLEQLRRDVRAQVEEAQVNFRVSLKLSENRLRNLSLARHILEQDEARFKIGRADANELNLDLGRVTDAEILSVQGLSQVHLAFMQLLHVFGQRVL